MHRLDHNAKCAYTWRSDDQPCYCHGMPVVCSRVDDFGSVFYAYGRFCPKHTVDQLLWLRALTDPTEVDIEQIGELTAVLWEVHPYFKSSWMRRALGLL